MRIQNNLERNKEYASVLDPEYCMDEGCLYEVKDNSKHSSSLNVFRCILNFLDETSQKRVSLGAGYSSDGFHPIASLDYRTVGRCLFLVFFNRNEGISDDGEKYIIKRQLSEQEAEIICRNGYYDKWAIR